MALEYKKASDGRITCPSWLFIGGPGTAKTTLIGQAAKHLREKRGGDFLIINMDATPERRAVKAVIESGATVIDQPKWVDIAQIMSADFMKFNAGIAIDNLSGYARECMFDVLGHSDAPRFNLGKDYIGKFNRNTWFIWGERLKNHMQTILGRGIPFIVTGHIRYDEDQLSGEVRKGINVWGQPAVEVPAMFTVSGVCDYKTDGKTETWRVRFRPEHGYPARDASGRLDPIEPCDFAKLWDKVTSPSVVAAPTVVKP